jgi:hypothetical protein
VDDLIPVQILDPAQNLHHVTLNFQVSQSAAPFQKLIQGLVCAKLKLNENIFSVLKHVLEFHNILMLHGPVDFNFRKNFRPLACFLQASLGHNF